MFGSLLIENFLFNNIFGTGLPCSIIYNDVDIEDYEKEDANEDND